MNFYIYSDASFNKNKQLGIYGFVILLEKDEHEKFYNSPSLELNVVTEIIKESNNIRCEIKGVIASLEFLSHRLAKENQDPKFVSIHIYSDCQTITELINRKNKLEKNNFKSLATNQLLSNADLYKQFFKLYDTFNLSIHWVKGHSKKENQSLNQKNFQVIDRIVRKQLRSIS